jgi:hypothetical protein
MTDFLRIECATSHSHNIMGGEILRLIDEEHAAWAFGKW